MNKPKLVLLLPITRDEITQRYIDGLIKLLSSPISMRVLIINKTQNSLDSIVSNFRNQVENLDCEILTRQANTGIFEGFMGLSIQENEWIMQIHDDDWVEGKIATFNPKSINCYFVPQRSKRQTSFRRHSDSNEWVFSAISSFFWNTLISYFDFIGQTPLPSSDYTLSKLIATLGSKEQFTDYFYNYSTSNWKIGVKQEHLRNILIQNGWSDFSNSRIATLNMKIDALAFSAFALLNNQSQENRSKLYESIKRQERDLLMTISRLSDAGWKSKLSRALSISEKVSQDELNYFACFLEVYSIRDLSGAFEKLEHLHIPALMKRAKKWSRLIASVGEQCES